MTLANAIGKGILAGAAGTAAMTVSSTVEAKVRGRAFSTAPADAAAKVLGIKDFTGQPAHARFSNLVHWGYGTGWGVVRGLLRARGVGPATATAGHLAGVWGSEQVMLPALSVAPPITLWGRNEIAIDGFHHAVYVLATAIAYELL
ncbi:MAG TPA: hypothetical protein VGW10_04795 [Solirubrobacteraceae bacterium]|nr:hypothetical protein [Solirubrobacteraceae bacterium]